MELYPGNASKGKKKYLDLINTYNLTTRIADLVYHTERLTDSQDYIDKATELNFVETISLYSFTPSPVIRS